MKKIFFLLLAVLMLGGCSKSTDKPDPYAGTFFIKSTVNGSWFLYNSDMGFPALGKTAEGWEVEKESTGQYSIGPTKGPSLEVAFYNAGTSVVLEKRSSPMPNTELFSFETVASSNLVNIKSTLDNKYVVLQYGLDASGNLIHWGITVDSKTTPCTADFSGSYPPSVTNGCQFDFELQKQ
jgi:Prokaryotic membrane lipoprotein lipid attachment site